jgi:hypothetical protein
MRDEPRTRRSRRNALLGGSLLLLGFGTSTVFSQAPEPAKPTAAPAPVERDPYRELLILKKEALQAEVKAAESRVGQAQRRHKNAQYHNRGKLQSDDYVFNAEVDVLERQAVLARKRAELVETSTRLQAYHRGTPQEGSNVDITDDLLRRIKDLEARVQKIEGGRPG